MTGSVLPFRRPSATPSGGRPAFDREHCDGCLTLVSRGSLVNRQVDGAAPGMDGWKALCRRCIRLLGEGRPYASLRPDGDRA